MSEGKGCNGAALPTGLKMSENGRFSGKRNIAIVALLSGASIQGAAEQAHISERQLHRWLNEDAFLQELRHQEGKVISACSWRLVSLAKQALDALEDVLNNPEMRGANVKRLTAVSILEMLLKWREQVDFETRLQTLERQVFINE